MLEYTGETPCFCHAVVRTNEVLPAPVILDVVLPTGEFNMAVLAHFDPALAAPYLGA
jgi:hypothetical protein